jgi:DNA mismatch repair protein MutL
VIEKITEERKVRPKKEENKNFYQTQLQSRASNFAFANVIEQPTQLQKKYKIIGQLLDTYILIETNTKSLLIVDQHVAEERYYYEKFYDEYMQNKRINSQSLLVPITFEFSPDEVQLIKENSNELKQFGLDIDIFGKDSILLRQIPLQINNLPSKEDLRQMILDLIMENNAGQTFEQKKDYIIVLWLVKLQLKQKRL